MGNRDLGRFINGGFDMLFLLGVNYRDCPFWIPNKVIKLKQGLKIKWSGNWKRVNSWPSQYPSHFIAMNLYFCDAATGPFCLLTGIEKAIRRPLTRIKLKSTKRGREESSQTYFWAKRERSTLDDSFWLKPINLKTFWGSKFRISSLQLFREPISIRKVSFWILLRVQVRMIWTFPPDKSG